MSGDPKAPSPNGRSGTTRLISEMSLGFLAFGLLAFCTYVLNTVVLDRLLYAAGFSKLALSSFVFAALLLVVVGVAVVRTYVRGRRGMAAGILGGYALITAVSGGESTGWGLQTSTSPFNGTTGAYVYAATLLVLTLACIVTEAVKARRLAGGLVGWLTTEIKIPSAPMLGRVPLWALLLVAFWALWVLLGLLR